MQSYFTLLATCKYVYVSVGLVEDCGPKLDSMCRLDGCRKSKKKSSNGELYEYCCKEHSEIAKSNGEDHKQSTDSVMK